MSNKDNKKDSRLEQAVVASYIKAHNIRLDIKDGIESLDKIRNIDENTKAILSISQFILKIQIIEFEIKDLIVKLNDLLHYQSQCNSSSFIIKKINKKHLDKKSLGYCIEILFSYNSDSLSGTLKKNLEDLTCSRNKLVHHLFDCEDTSNILVPSNTDIKIAESVLKNLQVIGGKVTEQVFKYYGCFLETKK